MLFCVQGFGGERVVEALLGTSVCTHPVRAAPAEQPFARGQSDPVLLAPSSASLLLLRGTGISCTKFGVDFLPMAGGSRHRRALGGAQPFINNQFIHFFPYNSPYILGVLNPKCIFLLGG